MANQSGIFSLNRTLNIIRLFAIEDGKPMVMAGLIIGIMIVASGMMTGYMPVGFLFNLALFIGIVTTSKVFSSVHYPEKGIYLMMLPASIEEKFIVKLAITTIGYFFLALVFCFIGFYIGHLAGATSGLYSGNPLIENLAGNLGTYLFFHSIFFLGSLYFRNSSFLKTALFTVALIFVFFLVLRMIMGAINIHWMDLLGDLNGMWGHRRRYRFDIQDDFSWLTIPLRILVPIALYFLSYLKFKRIEIKG